jgi:hypothetical protein
VGERDKRQVQRGDGPGFVVLHLSRCDDCDLSVGRTYRDANIVAHAELKRRPQMRRVQSKFETNEPVEIRENRMRLLIRLVCGYLVGLVLFIIVWSRRKKAVE